MLLLSLSRVITQYLLKCGAVLAEESNRIHPGAARAVLADIVHFYRGRVQLMPRPSRRLRILLLGSNEEPTILLRETLAKHAHVAAAWNMGELFGLLELGPYDTFLCDWECQQGVTWREICGEVKQIDPNLPIIVFSRLGGEQEWVEVLEAGCFDLVCAPYSDRKVLSIIEHAVVSQEAHALRTAA